ncbi:MAG: peptidylprolyl isomerase [Chloroflexota bacterium]|nr:peptidylprolyl isomerase [Chloroflexota bacterium]
MKEQEMTVQNEVVVSMLHRLRVDGEIVDQSESGHPSQFIQGIGQVVPGLENALYGMRVGDRKRVIVSPEDGYGEKDQDAYAEIPIREFPEDVPVEPGIELILKDDEGDEQEAYIVEVVNDFVRLSLNHPLAGEELEFEVKIVELREATKEELHHGHVHHS